MAERIVYVSSTLSVMLTMPSEKHTVLILSLDAARSAVTDPRLVTADVKIRYHGFR